MAMSDNEKTDVEREAQPMKQRSMFFLDILTQRVAGWAMQKWLESVVFSLIVLMEFFYIVFLVLSRHMVVHDTFFYISAQYYFLNNVIWSGEIPHWVPYMTHGDISTFLYAIQGTGSLLLNVLLHTGSLLKNVNFLAIAYLGFFVERLLLLLGVWCLAKRYFSSLSTVFFVTVSVMASSVWTGQVYFNFHFYYAIPFILYLWHLFLETKKWRYCFLAMNLFAIQCLDKVAYFIPMIALIVFLYCLFYYVVNLKSVPISLKGLNFGWAFWVGLITCLASCLPVAAMLHFAKDKLLVQNFFARNLDGTVPLEVFLTYPLDSSFRTLLELVLGFSMNKDYTLYIGVLSLPMLLFGLMYLNKKSMPIVMLLATLFFFCAGSYVATFFYYCWPLMKFFRHIPYLLVIIKIFLCFLAGFGLEAFITKARAGGGGERVLLISSVVLFGTAVFIYYLGCHDQSTRLLILWMRHELPEQFIARVSHLLGIASFKLFFLSVLLFLARRNIAQDFLKLLIFLMVALHLCDMCNYYHEETMKRTVAVDNTRYNLFKFQPLPFRERRSVEKVGNEAVEQNPRNVMLMFPTFGTITKDQVDQVGLDWGYVSQRLIKNYWGVQVNPAEIRLTVNTEQENVRMSKTFGENYSVILPVLQKAVLRRISVFSFYWTGHAFLFNDYIDTRLPTEYWLVPLDDFMRTYWGQTVETYSGQRMGIYGGIVERKQVEQFGLDWGDVSRKFLQNGWAERIDADRIRLIENMEARQIHRLANIFGANFHNILFILQQAHVGCLQFPTHYSAANKFGGLSEDKIQFFSQAHIIPDKKDLRGLITDQQYSGDVLFLSPLGPAARKDEGLLSWSAGDSLSSDERLKIPYKILVFNANHLILELHNPEHKRIWMFYSDVWHPHWKASVNNQAMPVYPANLAYKAVSLDPGYNKVHLFFDAPVLSLLYKMIGAIALFWVMVIIFGVMQIIIRPGLGEISGEPNNFVF